jgi:hypothetical protein
MKEEEYKMFLESQGFTNSRGINKNKLDHIARLTDKEIQWSKQKWKGCQHYFLRIGTHTQHDDLSSYTPRKQLADCFLTPPRLSRKESSKFTAAWNIYCQAVLIDKKESNKEKENLESSIERSKHNKVWLPVAVVVTPKQHSKLETTKQYYDPTKSKTLVMTDDKLHTAVDDILNVVARDLLKKIIHPSALANVEDMLLSSMTIGGLLDSLATSTMELMSESARGSYAVVGPTVLTTRSTGS